MKGYKVARVTGVYWYTNKTSIMVWNNVVRGGLLSKNNVCTNIVFLTVLHRILHDIFLINSFNKPNRWPLRPIIFILFVMEKNQVVYIFRNSDLSIGN